MTTKLSGPMLPPQAGGAPKSAVVLLHGYGSDGADLIGLGQYWAASFPHTLFLAPNGPEPCPGNPFGYQWFALDLEDRTSRVENGRRAAPVVLEFLADLWSRTELTPAATVLGGFSQGAMMALHVGLSLEEPLAGIVAFSGALDLPEPLPTARPPVLLVHGEFDTVVEAAESARAETELKARGFDVTHHVSPGIGHSISNDGLDAATVFVRRVLPA